MPFSKPVFCWLAALVLLLLLAAQAAPVPSLAQVLRTSRWQQRLVLIGAPTASQPELLRQQALLAAASAGLAERDVRVLAVPYDQLSPADRRCWQQLGQSLGSFVVVLIGKDGGVKRTSSHPLAPADLFSTIDQMPMRRQEMRRGEK